SGHYRRTALQGSGASPSPCESPDIRAPSSVPVNCRELPSRSKVVKRISVPGSRAPITASGLPARSPEVASSWLVLRRVDRNAAVARAEVDDQVAARGIGHLQHAPDHALRRRHPDRVPALLADLG